MRKPMSERGVTLIELLVTMAILSLILAGLYQMFDSGHKTYMRIRALTESQQTARVVMNYLTFRLREIDGGGSGALARDPRVCTDCHIPDMDKMPNVDDPYIPCEMDVLVPRPNLFIDPGLLEVDGTTGAPSLKAFDPGDLDTNLPAEYTSMSGSSMITFWADLLPAQGLSDTFIDSPSTGSKSSFHNGKWDLEEDGGVSGEYDVKEGDREMLYFDYNDNGLFDYYGEKWSFRLMTTTGTKFYNLVESLSFGNYTSKNRSVYDSYLDSGPTHQVYKDAPVAYGLTGLGISLVPKYYDGAHFASEFGTDTTNFGGLQGKAASSCASKSGCHDTAALNLGTATKFEYVKFNQKHPWWNIRGLSVEVATSDLGGKKLIKLKQFLIPRNLEVNNK